MNAKFGKTIATISLAGWNARSLSPYSFIAVFVVIGCYLASLAFFGDRARLGSGQIHWETPKVDPAAILVGQVEEVQFEFSCTNRTTSRQQVDTIRSSCSCAAVSANFEFLEPNMVGRFRGKLRMARGLAAFDVGATIAVAFKGDGTRSEFVNRVICRTRPALHSAADAIHLTATTDGHYKGSTTIFQYILSGKGDFPTASFEVRGPAKLATSSQKWDESTVDGSFLFRRTNLSLVALTDNLGAGARSADFLIHDARPYSRITVPIMWEQKSTGYSVRPTSLILRDNPAMVQVELQTAAVDIARIRAPDCLHVKVHAMGNYRNLEISRKPHHVEQFGHRQISLDMRVGAVTEVARIAVLMMKPSGQTGEESHNGHGQL